MSSQQVIYRTISTFFSATAMVMAALLVCMSGCAGRMQHAVDKSMLIQENLQLDQALNIAQYELMIAQQENETLRKQLERVSPNGSAPGDRLPSLRSTYESENGTGDAPTFDANDPALPPPSNQMPSRFRRQPNITPPQPGSIPRSGQSNMRQRTMQQQQVVDERRRPQSDSQIRQAALDWSHDQYGRSFGTASPVIQASGVPYTEVPTDAPQWSPQR